MNLIIKKKESRLDELEEDIIIKILTEINTDITKSV